MLKVLYLGPGHSSIVRGRVTPFVGEFRVEWISPTPIPARSLRAHPALRFHLLPRPGLERLPKALKVHTADYLLGTWRRIARFRPDVIHVHYPSPVDALALAPVRRTPIVLSVMGGDVLEEQVPRSPLQDLLLRKLFRRSALVSAKSEFLAEACRELGAEEERVRVVRWGIDTSRFAPSERTSARVELGLEEEGLFLLSSRALEPLYNHAHVVEALAELSPSLPRVPTLVFSLNAADAAYAEKIRRRVEEVGLKARFLEPLTSTRMPLLYAAADACVSIPASDGLPQTLLESLACARPALGLDLAAYRELPFAEDALIRVRHHGGQPDRQALCEGLRALLVPRERPGLAVARDWIVEHAELGRSVEQVAEAYRQLVTR